MFGMQPRLKLGLWNPKTRKLSHTWAKLKSVYKGEIRKFIKYIPQTQLTFCGATVRNVTLSTICPTYRIQTCEWALTSHNQRLSNYHFAVQYQYYFRTNVFQYNKNVSKVEQLLMTRFFQQYIFRTRDWNRLTRDRALRNHRMT